MFTIKVSIQTEICIILFECLIKKDLNDDPRLIRPWELPLSIFIVPKFRGSEKQFGWAEMLISEKQCREDLERSETSLCYTVLSLKVPSGQAYQKVTADYQLANFTF